MILVSGGVALITAPTDGYVALTVSDLIAEVANYMGQRYAVGATTANTAANILTDTKRPEGPQRWQECFLKATSGANNGLQFVITDWTPPDFTLTPPANIWDTGDTYRLTPFDQIACLAQGQVRGYFDVAVDDAYPELFYEIALEGLTSATGDQEYSWRTISADTHIDKLRQVEWRISSTYEWSNLPFELVGDGSSFRAVQYIGAGYPMRIKGLCPPLRTNAAGTVINRMGNETDKVILHWRRVGLLVALIAKIIKERQIQGNDPNVTIGPSLKMIVDDIAEKRASFKQQPARPHPRTGGWF